MQNRVRKNINRICSKNTGGFSVRQDKRFIAKLRCFNLRVPEMAAIWGRRSADVSCAMIGENLSTYWEFAVSKSCWQEKNDTMNLTAQIAKHLRAVYFGGNWTSVNLKDSLTGITWRQATTKVYSFNTIATLVYHVGYYISAVSRVLQGGPLDAHDKYSFDHPPIQTQEDWEKLLDKTWTDAENFARLIEQLPESKLGETFIDDKYGNYYRNLHGIVEYIHYHLGQIVLIKKLLLQAEEK